MIQPKISRNAFIKDGNYKKKKLTISIYEKENRRPVN